MKRFKYLTALLLFFPWIIQAEWLELSTQNLPDTIIVNHAYKDVSFTLTNRTTSNISIKVIDIKVPLGFPTVGVINTCNNTILAPNASCSLVEQTTYLPINSSETQATWSSHVTDEIEFYTKGITKTVATTGLVGTISTPLPTNSHEAVPQPVVFTFSNIGTIQTSNLNIDIPSLTGLSLTNQCGAVLAPSNSCTVSGTYTPPTSMLGQQASVTVVAQTGTQSVPLTTSTTVENVDVTGSVTTPLGMTSAVGVAHPLVYTHRQ